MISSPSPRPSTSSPPSSKGYEPLLTPSSVWHKPFMGPSASHPWLHWPTTTHIGVFAANFERHTSVYVDVLSTNLWADDAWSLLLSPRLHRWPSRLHLLPSLLHLLPYLLYLLPHFIPLLLRSLAHLVTLLRIHGW